jgi:rare lipoprotein A
MRGALCTILVLAVLVLVACGTVERRGQTSSPPPAPNAPSNTGKYYDNDGPDANPPPHLVLVPDAVPRAEPLHKFANQPYAVFGKSYVPAAMPPGARQGGRASWYGRKFHGSRTASGEVYDMYAMTAAHPTLPIPSYARVRNVENGRSVVVRVNDRGPFLRDRVIDLSYTAALKLGYVQQGSARVEVEPIVFSGVSAPVAARPGGKDAASSPPRQPSGHFVQLGAFRNASSAETFHRRVAAQLDWMGELLHIAERNGLLRVWAGPYASADEAGAAVQRITRSTGFSPVLTRF